METPTGRENSIVLEAVSKTELVAREFVGVISATKSPPQVPSAVGTVEVANEQSIEELQKKIEEIWGARGDTSQNRDNINYEIGDMAELIVETKKAKFTNNVPSEDNKDKDTCNNISSRGFIEYSDLENESIGCEDDLETSLQNINNRMENFSRRIRSMEEMIGEMNDVMKLVLERVNKTYMKINKLKGSMEEYRMDEYANPHDPEP